MARLMIFLYQFLSFLTFIHFQSMLSANSDTYGNTKQTEGIKTEYLVSYITYHECDIRFIPKLYAFDALVHWIILKSYTYDYKGAIRNHKLSNDGVLMGQTSVALNCDKYGFQYDFKCILNTLVRPSLLIFLYTLRFIDRIW